MDFKYYIIIIASILINLLNLIYCFFKTYSIIKKINNEAIENIIDIKLNKHGFNSNLNILTIKMTFIEESIKDINKFISKNTKLFVQ